MLLDVVNSFCQHCLKLLEFDNTFCITNSCFLLVSIMLRKFDTSSKKELKMIKTQI